MRVFDCAWKINFLENIFSWPCVLVSLTRKWFKVKIFSSNHFRTHAQRERERERKISRLRLQLCTDQAFDFAPIAPQDHTETAPIALRSHHTVASKRHWSHRLHWERTQGSHWDRTDLSLSRSSVAVLHWPDLMNFFFYWVLFLCLSIEKLYYIFVWKLRKYEKNVRNKKKICFLYYFQQHNQTLKNIFQNIFWNATKYLKIFSFPENSISEKYLFFGKYLFFEKYFTWTKHSLRLSNYETNRTLTQLKP